VRLFNTIEKLKPWIGSDMKKFSANPLHEVNPVLCEGRTKGGSQFIPIMIPISVSSIDGDFLGLQPPHHDSNVLDINSRSKMQE
jgi:hypothetical protein